MTRNSTKFLKKIPPPSVGLEGPYIFPNGRILWFDTKEQMYYDHKTDFFVEEDELAVLQMSLFSAIGKVTEFEK